MSQDLIAVLIKRASLALDKKANALLQPHGLTNAQFKILKYLIHKEESYVTQKMIEEDFSMTNPTVTGIIQNLEKKELIYRHEHPTDKRSKIIRLTQKAIALKPQLAATGKTINDEFISGLTSEQQEELTTLLKLLVK